MGTGAEIPPSHFSSLFFDRSSSVVFPFFNNEHHNCEVSSETYGNRNNTHLCDYLLVYIYTDSWAVLQLSVLTCKITILPVIDPHSPSPANTQQERLFT